jgi:hypothetical protein
MLIVVWVGAWGDAIASSRRTPTSAAACMTSTTSSTTAPRPRRRGMSREWVGVCIVCALRTAQSRVRQPRAAGPHR